MAPEYVKETQLSHLSERVARGLDLEARGLKKLREPRMKNKLDNFASIALSLRTDRDWSEVIDLVPTWGNSSSGVNILFRLYFAVHDIDRFTRESFRPIDSKFMLKQ